VQFFDFVNNLCWVPVFAIQKTKRTSWFHVFKKIQRHRGRIFMKKSGKEPAALVGYMTPQVL
jgi:hypothetical protein